MFDIEKYQKCLNFLQENNTHQIQHSHSTFFNHLIGTFNILRKWKQHEDVCFAGMFHNVYGNKYFNPQLKITREQVKDLIGDKAEQLAYDFHYIKRDTIVNTNNKDQIILMLANEFDQNPLLEVFDNLYDKQICKELDDYFRKVHWQFTGRNNTDLSQKWNYDLSFESEQEKFILNNQNMVLKKLGLNHLVEIKRVYASAHQFGHFGEFHVDEQAQEFNEKFTLMYYLNNDWDISWAGETAFLTRNNQDIHRSIIPKPGRGILFDSFIKHGSRPINKVFTGVRMVLTFKYKLI